MNYTCVTFFTSELSEKHIQDFIYVQNEVFSKTPMSRDDFRLKFQNNVYGDSIICIVYAEDGKPAGARAFWRNDICGRLAYQPSDTAVCKEHRRQGLFVMMTNAALYKASGNAIIYNFPNENSYPQYLKLGWSDYKIQYTRIFSSRKYLREDPSVIDNNYLKWWIMPRTDASYGQVKRMGRYYLVRKLNDKGRYIIFGQISKEASKLFPPVSPKLLVFHSAKKPFYNRSGKVACKIVALNASASELIPNWKTDVL